MQRIRVANVFSFRSLSTTVDSQYYRTEKQATKEWSSLIPLVGLYFVLSLLSSYIYFDSNRKKVSIQTIHGYTNMHKYSQIIGLNVAIIILSVISVIMLKTPLSSYLFNQYASSFVSFDKVIILFGVVLVFIDVTVIICNMTYFEKRALLIERRG